MPLCRMIQMGLLGLLCVSFVVAETTPTPAPIVSTLPTTMPGGPVISRPVHSDGSCCTPSCPTACAAPCCPTTCAKPAPVCVAAVENKTHIHTHYSIKCKTICLPSCFGGRCVTGGCATDACSTSSCDNCKSCGKPREVRRLIKRFVKEEHCEVVCKPQESCHLASCPISDGAPVVGAPVVMPRIDTSIVVPPAKLPTGK